MKINLNRIPWWVIWAVIVGGLFVGLPLLWLYIHFRHSVGTGFPN